MFIWDFTASAILEQITDWIFSKLISNGFEAYVVGGCVRDSILGKVPNDWDICTDATPEEILNVFNGKPILRTGIEYGTVTIMINEIGYEITRRKNSQGRNSSPR